VKRALILLALAGCQLSTASRGGSTPDEPERSTETSRGIAGAIVRDQLVTLYGKTPDDAKAALAGWGHDGAVMVMTDDRHHDGCEVGRVCRFDRPESGMGVHDPITLYTNPRR
jgi:hypothetical protein